MQQLDYNSYLHHAKNDVYVMRHVPKPNQAVDTVPKLPQQIHSSQISTHHQPIPPNHRNLFGSFSAKTSLNDLDQNQSVKQSEYITIKPQSQRHQNVIQTNQFQNQKVTSPGKILRKSGTLPQINEQVNERKSGQDLQSKTIFGHNFSIKTQNPIVYPKRGKSASDVTATPSSQELITLEERLIYSRFKEVPKNENQSRHQAIYGQGSSVHKKNSEFRRVQSVLEREKLARENSQNLFISNERSKRSLDYFKKRLGSKQEINPQINLKSQDSQNSAPHLTQIIDEKRKKSASYRNMRNKKNEDLLEKSTKYEPLNNNYSQKSSSFTRLPSLDLQRQSRSDNKQANVFDQERSMIEIDTANYQSPIKSSNLHIPPFTINFAQQTHQNLSQRDKFNQNSANITNYLDIQGNSLFLPVFAQKDTTTDEQGSHNVYQLQNSHLLYNSQPAHVQLHQYPVYMTPNNLFQQHHTNCSPNQTQNCQNLGCLGGISNMIDISKNENLSPPQNIQQKKLEIKGGKGSSISVTQTPNKIIIRQLDRDETETSSQEKVSSESSECDCSFCLEEMQKSKEKKKGKLNKKIKHNKVKQPGSILRQKKLVKNYANIGKSNIEAIQIPLNQQQRLRKQGQDFDLSNSSCSQFKRSPSDISNFKNNDMFRDEQTSYNQTNTIQKMNLETNQNRSKKPRNLSRETENQKNFNMSEIKMRQQKQKSEFERQYRERIRQQSLTKEIRPPIQENITLSRQSEKQNPKLSVQQDDNFQNHKNRQIKDGKIGRKKIQVESVNHETPENQRQENNMSSNDKFLYPHLTPIEQGKASLGSDSPFLQRWVQIPPQNRTRQYSEKILPQQLSKNSLQRDQGPSQNVQSAQNTQEETVTLSISPIGQTQSNSFEEVKDKLDTAFDLSTGKQLDIKEKENQRKSTMQQKLDELDSSLVQIQVDESMQFIENLRDQLNQNRNYKQRKIHLDKVKKLIKANEHIQEQLKDAKSENDLCQVRQSLHQQIKLAKELKQEIAKCQNLSLIQELQEQINRNQAKNDRLIDLEKDFQSVDSTYDLPKNANLPKNMQKQVTIEAVDSSGEYKATFVNKQKSITSRIFNVDTKPVNEQLVTGGAHTLLSNKTQQVNQKQISNENDPKSEYGLDDNLNRVQANSNKKEPTKRLSKLETLLKAKKEVKALEDLDDEPKSSLDKSSQNFDQSDQIGRNINMNNLQQMSGQLSTKSILKKKMNPNQNQYALQDESPCEDNSEPKNAQVKFSFEKPSQLVPATLEEVKNTGRSKQHKRLNRQATPWVEDSDNLVVANSKKNCDKNQTEDGATSVGFGTYIANSLTLTNDDRHQQPQSRIFNTFQTMKETTDKGPKESESDKISPEIKEKSEDSIPEFKSDPLDNEALESVQEESQSETDSDVHIQIRNKNFSQKVKSVAKKSQNNMQSTRSPSSDSEKSVSSQLNRSSNSVNIREKLVRQSTTRVPDKFSHLFMDLSSSPAQTTEAKPKKVKKILPQTSKTTKAQEDKQRNFSFSNKNQDFQSSSMLEQRSSIDIVQSRRSTAQFKQEQKPDSSHHTNKFLDLVNNQQNSSVKAKELDQVRVNSEKRKRKILDKNARIPNSRGNLIKFDEMDEEGNIVKKNRTHNSRPKANQKSKLSSSFVTDSESEDSSVCTSDFISSEYSIDDFGKRRKSSKKVRNRGNSKKTTNKEQQPVASLQRSISDSEEEYQKAEDLKRNRNSLVARELFKANTLVNIKPDLIAKGSSMMVLGDGAHIVVDQEDQHPKTAKNVDRVSDEKQDFLSEVKSMIERKHTRQLEKKKRKEDKHRPKQSQQARKDKDRSRQKAVDQSVSDGESENDFEKGSRTQKARNQSKIGYKKQRNKNDHFEQIESVSDSQQQSLDEQETRLVKGSSRKNKDQPKEVKYYSEMWKEKGSSKKKTKETLHFSSEEEMCDEQTIDFIIRKAATLVDEEQF